jgi:hypothetical protein
MTLSTISRPSDWEIPGPEVHANAPGKSYIEKQAKAP